MKNMKIKAIVAGVVMDDGRLGIGYKGQLLFHIPEDMKFFKEQTTGSGKVLIAGRKTIESLPNGLKDREFIILSRTCHNMYVNGEMQLCVDSVERVMETLKYLECTGIEEAYIIGGGEVYEAMLPYTDEVLLTFIMPSKEEPKVDTYLVDLSNDFSQVKTLKEGSINECAYEMTKWVRKSK